MNPFSYGTVVKQPFFFDRIEEKEKIIKTLKGGNNLVLYAPRRYGKTSLVMQVIDALSSPKNVCIYFDFMTIYSKESFIQSFSKAILNHQNNIPKAVESFSKFVKGIRPILSFDHNGKPEFSFDFDSSKISDRSLETVIDLPDKLASNNRKFFIIMDEFQDITKLNGENFEKLLRSKIQHHRNVNYLFLGSRTHLLKDMFTSKNRPFYNSALTMHLDPLPLDDTVAFLNESFLQNSIEIDEPTALYLIEKAGNIPYYIQFLASEVWQYCVDRIGKVDKSIIDSCANEILDLKSDYYFELFDRHTSYQKKLMNTLALDNKNVFSTEYAKEHRLSAPSTTQKALNGLIDSNIIEKIGNQYNYCDPFFREYILRLPA